MPTLPLPWVLQKHSSRCKCSHLSEEFSFTHIILWQRAKSSWWCRSKRPLRGWWNTFKQDNIICITIFTYSLSQRTLISIMTTSSALMLHLRQLPTQNLPAGCFDFQLHHHCITSASCWKKQKHRTNFVFKVLHARHYNITKKEHENI